MARPVPPSLNGTAIKKRNSFFLAASLCILPCILWMIYYKILLFKGNATYTARALTPCEWIAQNIDDWDCESVLNQLDDYFLSAKSSKAYGYTCESAACYSMIPPTTVEK